jgi:hypothetical protein
LCFYEILAGKSRVLPENGGVFFYKHPTLFELEMSGEFKERYTLRAKQGGMLDEQEMLQAAKSNGGWSVEKEAEITELKWLAEKQEKALKKVADEPSLLQTFQNNLNETTHRLEELRIKREALTRFSLENYVSEKVNMELFRRFIFDDEDCIEPTDQATVMSIMPTFMTKYDDLMDQDATLRRCYNPSFFELFLLSSADPLKIFGKNIYELTIFQKNLLVYSFVLRRKIDNIPDIPASVIDNPIALYNYDPDEKNGGQQEEMNIREFVNSRGGEENLKPEDYVT